MGFVYKMKREGRTQAVVVIWAFWSQIFTRDAAMEAKVLFVVVFAVLACALAAGAGEGSTGGAPSTSGAPSNASPSAKRNGFGYFGRQGYDGRELQGREGYYGRDRYGQDPYRRYRTNLYGDDDVYGYDSTYPNGEAAYINYRSKDARSRRGPEFERISRAYSRQNEPNQSGYPGFGSIGQGVFRSAFGQPA